MHCSFTTPLWKWIVQDGSYPWCELTDLSRRPRYHSLWYCCLLEHGYWTVILHHIHIAILWSMLGQLVDRNCTWPVKRTATQKPTTSGITLKSPVTQESHSGPLLWLFLSWRANLLLPQHQHSTKHIHPLQCSGYDSMCTSYVILYRPRNSSFAVVVVVKVSDRHQSLS